MVTQPADYEHMSRRARLTAFGGLLVAALIFFGLTSQTTLGAQPTGSVELVAQSPWVDDGAIYNIQVRTAGASPESTIVVRVFSPWTERSAFLRQEMPEDTELLLELNPVLLSDAQETSNEVLDFEILLDGPATQTPEAVLEAAPNQQEQGLPALLSDGDSAIYPVEVALIDRDGQVTDSFLTSIIELPRRDLRPPLAVSTVLDANVDFASAPGQVTELSEDALAELAVFSNAVSQHPNTNIALSVSPQTLVTVAQDERPAAVAITSSFSDNLSPAQLLPNPLADVEEQAWFDADLTSELVELYEAGSAAAAESIGVEPSKSVLFLDPTTTSDGISGIRDLGVQGVIVQPNQLSALDRGVFPHALTTRFFIEGQDADTEDVPALVTNSDLAGHFTADGGSILNANRLLADLVLLSLQDDGGRHSVVVNPPEDWVPDTRFLNVYLSGVERIPALLGATPEQALADTEITPRLGLGSISGPLTRELDPSTSAQSLRSFRTEYSQARNAIESWTAVIGQDTASRRDLNELLYLSAGHDQTETEQIAFIEAVYSFINTQKDSAITTPAADTITLTGRESLIPIVLENRLSTPATVLMILTSGELDFAEGSEIVQTLEPGSNRIEVPIIARASGDSPIQIQVLSPDGTVLLGSTEVLVRTFAFSGIGIAIGGVAIIVLFFWWLRHVRGTRDTVGPPMNEHSPEANEMIGV